MSREQHRLLQEEESPVEPGRYGCPMLNRGHAIPTKPGLPLARCSVGWAIHGEIDLLRCQATESILDCWKVHPERTPVVVLPNTAGPEFAYREQKASAD